MSTITYTPPVYSFFKNILAFLFMIYGRGNSFFSFYFTLDDS